jgi:hypothetical protein
MESWLDTSLIYPNHPRMLGNDGEAPLKGLPHRWADYIQHGPGQIVLPLIKVNDLHRQSRDRVFTIGCCPTGTRGGVHTCCNRVTYNLSIMRFASRTTLPSRALLVLALAALAAGLPEQ